MKGAIQFTSPQAFETTFNLPSGRAVTGMSIPEGITLIVGGGYHGKSTLLGSCLNVVSMIIFQMMVVNLLLHVMTL